jgi:sigma-E factor negative regulatory protein RseA
MKAKISALMDGELERHEADAALDALKHEGEAHDTWRTYHLIGDSMRDARQLSAGFAARVTAKLADEPTVLAPPQLPIRRPLLEQRRWQVLSMAASLAAVAFVVSVAFAPQEGAVTAPPLAQSAPPAETAQVAPPDAANDYVLAHQGYSPRISLQGMAPYVRTVSSDARPVQR